MVHLVQDVRLKDGGVRESGEEPDAELHQKSRRGGAPNRGVDGDVAHLSVHPRRYRNHKCVSENVINL